LLRTSARKATRMIITKFIIALPKLFADFADYTGWITTPDQRLIFLANPDASLLSLPSV
jgi:hypothetical protein